jgi:hypothetical protein
MGVLWMGSMVKAPTPLRSHPLPWKTDVLPPMNKARYARQIHIIREAATGREIPVAVPPAYVADENHPDGAPVPVPQKLVDALAGVHELSKGKTRKAIQGGRAWVRGADGAVRQMFDADYRLGDGETAVLDD